MENAYKLLYAFAGPKIDGASLDYLTSPRECITGLKKGVKQSLMVTFGMKAYVGKPINIYTSITPQGKETTVDLARLSNSFYTTLRATPLSDEVGLFLMVMEVQDVVIDSDGVYEVNVRLFPSDETPSQENQLDSIRSFFFAKSIHGDSHAVK